jgi:cobalamin biosynthetic protein CobC
MGLRSGNDANTGASTAAAAAKHASHGGHHDGYPIHGGDLDAARHRFPGALEPWIDLSTGINPIPYPIPDIAPQAWTRLPLASDEQALLSAAATRYGAAGPDNVVAAAGSQGVIQVIPRLLAPTRVAILSPTYKEHLRAWSRSGHDAAEVTSFAYLAEASAAVVVNPNNPTGRLIPPGELVWLAGELSARGGLLIVDEAFLDVLDRSASVIPQLPRSTIVLRSFGKTYGLAGLRLGFAVSTADICTRLRNLLGPWAVSGPALEVGRAALSDDAWLEAAKRRLAKDAARLDTLLTAHGLAVVGGTPLFRLASHPDAGHIANALGQNGILVRAFDYEPTWLRFGIPGSLDAWQRLETALRTVESPLPAMRGEG